MARKLALLGSVNVGGNRIAMADLRDRLASAGFANVATVAASGNVLFDADPSCDDEHCAARIAGVLHDAYGFDSLVVVLDGQTLRSAIDDNPFRGSGEDRFVHTIFLDRQPTQERFDALLSEHRAKGGERLALGEKMLFLDYVHGVGVSSLTGAFLQRRLECRGTARNMSSLERIAGKMT